MLLSFGILPASAFSQVTPDSPVLPTRDTLPPRVSLPTAAAQQAPARRDTTRMLARDTVHRPAPDSVKTEQQDTAAIVEVDSVSLKPWLMKDWDIDFSMPVSNQLLEHHPFFGFGDIPVIVSSDRKIFEGKEKLFFLLIGLLWTFALLRQSFPKYFSDLFRLFFRTTLKYRQLRDQLMQTPLPSLLLNIFFVVTGGLYFDLLLQHFHKDPVGNFWILFAYCSGGLAAIYSVKFAGLKIAGWLFNVHGAADAYIFVVFIINKVLGIFLLPFVVLLSFVSDELFSIVMVISWCGIGIILIYRILLTFSSVRNQVRFNPFHFLLYLCAFEIAPLLLIYKALLFFFQ